MTACSYGLVEHNVHNNKEYIMSNIDKYCRDEDDLDISL